MRCVAVDWSGRTRGAEEHIWIAETRDGRLMGLENGRGRAEAVARVIAAAREDPALVAGFDFAFSFPAWYCRAQGWNSGPEVWRGVRERGEDLLAECPPPFWGRPGIGRREPVERGLRRTDRLDAPGAKSVFQIGGAGAVGTGSLRGMGLLLDLLEAGFGVWPFTGAGAPLALEIYPRALYSAPVRKRRRAERTQLLRARFPDQEPELLARAEGSEDAFDAAVSALVMADHAPVLRGLTAAPEWALEGRIWRPGLRGR